MIQSIYPTTPSQQGFILGTLTASPDDALFIEQIVVPLAGPFNINRFRATWRELVAAHEILRSGFAWNVSGEPRQVVLDTVEVDMVLVDVAEDSPSAQQRDLERILEMHRSQPFDLRRPPLIRLSLQRRGDQDHVLIWSHHHAILDGWSQMNLLEQMLHRYHRTDYRGSAPSFGKYATWLGQQPSQNRQTFWTAALQGYEPLPSLPRMSRSEQEGRFGSYELVVPTNQVRALLDQARRNELTMASVLISLWGVALSRFRDSAKIIVGLTVAARSDRFPRSSDILGPFVNTIPIGLELDADEAFVTYAGRVQRAVADASQFDDASSGQIHRWLGFSGGQSLFDSVVAIANYPKANIEEFANRGELHFTPEQMQASGGRTLQPLSLVASLLNDLTLRLVYRRDRIDDGVAAQLMDCVGVNLATFTSQGQSANVGEMLRQVYVRASATLVEPETVPTEPGVHSVEDFVAATFAAVLGAKSVGLDDSFIARGGHSILALELLRNLCSRFSVDLTLHDLISAQTPAAIARRIREHLASGSAVVELLPHITRGDKSDEPFALTQIQQAYWVGRQGGFELGSVDSHLYGEFDVKALDLDRLDLCWQEVIRRHEMLRAVLTDDGQQVVLRTVPEYHIAVTDLRADKVVPGISLIRERLSNARRTVTQWPLFAIEAARLPGNTTRLFLSFDLLIGDALSWKVLYADVAALYNGTSGPLPPLGISYRDYVVALQNLGNTPAYLRDKTYWRARLNTLPPPPIFPLLPAGEDPEASQFKRREFRLKAPQVQQLRERASGLGVTPSVLLLTIFGEVLARFTGSREFLLNLTVFNRLQLHPDVNHLVGNFTSLSMTAVEIAPAGQLFADSVWRLQRRLWEDLDHRLYSGLEVLRDLAERSGNPRSAQAPVVFTSTLELSQRKAHAEPPPWTFVHGIGQTPQVLLDYQTFEIGDEVVIIWDGVEARFPPSYLDLMFKVHESLLKSVIADGTAHVDQFRRAPTPAPLAPHPDCANLLQHPFIRQARRRPDNVAVITAERRLSYKQLLNGAVEVGRRINGATSELELVAVVMEKGWEQIVGVLGALLSGRAFVPFDPSWPPHRLSRLFSKAPVSAVLTQPRFCDLLGPLTTAPVLSVDATVVSAADSSLREVPKIDTPPDALAYVIFTSGSTGSPKGVMIQHSAALNTILEVNDRFSVDDSDRTFAISPLVFDLSIYDIFGTLAAGGAIVIPSEAERTTPLAWSRMMAACEVTIWNSVPSLMGLLVDAVPRGDQQSLRALRLCLLSGDWIPLTLPDAVREVAPAARVISLGGATEGAIWSICYEIGVIEPGWSSVPYGFALRGQSVEVLGQDLCPSMVWVAGDIHIGGHGVAMGYLDEPALTDQTFILDQHGRRLYRTGDRGRVRPDGAIEFLGRDDGQVKVNGHRIELREVEAALEAAQGVESAAVVAVGDRTNRRLAGFFIGGASEATVRQHLSSHLAAYMVPTTLQRLAVLPLSAVGKVDRDALAKQAVEAVYRAAPADAPATIDGELLAVVRKAIGVDSELSTNLLSHGLTSIDIIRLLNAIERQFGSRPSIESFYRDPTVRGLRRSLAAVVNSEKPKAVASVSGWTCSLRITDPGQRAAFRKSVRQRNPSPDGMPLPGRSIDKDSYRRRRSARNFADRPVSLEAVGRMLESLRAEMIEGDLKFLYPSAGGLYAVDIYVHIRPDRVGGLEAGLYRYDAITHELSPVVLDIDFNSLLHGGAANHRLADTAALTLFLTTEPENSAPLYGEEAQVLALLNAGYIGQTICQHAAEQGLAVCPLHGFGFDRIRSLIPGRGNSVLLHLLVCGSPISDDAQGLRHDGAAGITEAATTQAVCSAPLSLEKPFVLRTAPLSPGQERLLDAEYRQANGSWPPAGSSSLLRPRDINAILIEGALDANALERAISALVERHSTLRTTVRFRTDGVPLQIITPPRPFDLIVEQRLNPADSNLIALLTEYSHAAVCPTRLDLFDARLVQLDVNRYVLFLAIHHLISDGWSIGVMFRDLSELYNAIVGSRETELPIIEHSFDEYARQMARRRHEGSFEGQLAFWVRTLGAKAITLRLPSIGGDDSGDKIDDHPVHLPSDLVVALRDASATAKVPGGISGPLFAAVALVLQEICSQQQIDIGCMVPGRVMPHSEFAIGFFTNTVTIRLNADPQISVGDFISAANLQIAAALQNQEAPIQDVAARLRENGSLGADQPPFQVTIALNDLRKESLTLFGLHCSDVNRTEHGDLRRLRPATTSVKLRWLLEERPTGIHGSVTYALNCFSIETIGKLVDRLTEMLRELVQSDGSVGELIRRPAAGRSVVEARSVDVVPVAGIHG